MFMMIMMVDGWLVGGHHHDDHHYYRPTLEFLEIIIFSLVRFDNNQIKLIAGGQTRCI